MKSKILPERILVRMDPADRPKGQLTAEEAEARFTARTEKDEQRQFAGWLRYARDRGELLFDHDGMHKRRTGTLGKPDFSIYAANRLTFFFEFKTCAGRLSSEQDAFCKQLTNFGYDVYIVRSADQAIKISREKLHGKAG
jgi:hypothetical protein